jgi:hypothetical protein
MESSGLRWYINIGFESFHQSSLETLKKPLTSQDVKKAFSKAVEINMMFRNIEISGNFVLWNTLSEEHIHLIKENLSGNAAKTSGQLPMTIYLSPVTGQYGDDSGTIMKMVKDIQRNCHAPCFLYLLTGL